MTDDASAATLVRTGRPLDANGTPTDGPTLELDPTGDAAALLRESPNALVSSPGAGTWATLLERPDDGATDRPVLLQWLAPDAAEPPAHVHPKMETFEAVEGELTVVVEGETRRLGPGDAVTVQPGDEHAFRNDTDELVAFKAELPSMRTALVLYSIWGLDHEGAFGSGGDYGQPDPVHGLLLAEAAHDETAVTTPPLAVQRFLWATVGRVAEALGYRSVDERYLDDAFWERRVEQPEL